MNSSNMMQKYSKTSFDLGSTCLFEIVSVCCIYIVYSILVQQSRTNISWKRKCGFIHLRILIEQGYLYLRLTINCCIWIEDQLCSHYAESILNRIAKAIHETLTELKSMVHLGIQSIFCMKSLIKGPRIHQLDSLPNSANTGRIS